MEFFMKYIKLKYPTHGLVHLIRKLEDKNEIEKRDKILMDIKKLIYHLDIYTEMGINRYNEVVGLIDELESINPSEKPISCKKGCSSCCNLLVHVTKSEAMVLAEEAIKLNVDIDKLERQSKISSPDEWFNLSVDDRRCVFLKDNICTVYDKRPVYCKKMKVITDPIFCSNDDGKIGHVISLIAEIIHTAFANCKGEIDETVGATLSQLTLSILNERNNK